MEARVTKIEGNLIYLEGFEYPIKGIPTQTAVESVAIIKKLFLEWPRISLERIKNIGLIALNQHLLKREQMSEAPAEIRRMLPTDLGLLISHTLQYDSAYRLRFKHMCDAVSQYELATKPQASLKKMLRLNRQNDYIGVHLKIRKLIFLLRILLLWPPLKAKWKETTLKCNFSNLQTDEIDRYWLSLRTDYGDNNGNPIT